MLRVLSVRPPLKPGARPSNGQSAQHPIAQSPRAVGFSRAFTSGSAAVFAAGKPSKRSGPAKSTRSVAPRTPVNKPSSGSRRTFGRLDAPVLDRFTAKYAQQRQSGRDEAARPTRGGTGVPSAADDMADLKKISYEYTPSPRVTQALHEALAKAETVVENATNDTEPSKTGEVNNTAAGGEAGEVQAQKIERKPVVAIVGRPNVGKSTMFNRLIRQSKSIITDTAGTTRDRKYGVCEWRNFPMLLIDTGGLLGEGDGLFEHIHEQAATAIKEADFVVCLVDVTQGIQQHDKTLANLIRRAKKPVLLAVNKCDNETRIEQAKQYIQLGLGEPLAVSASHGIATETLVEKVSDWGRATGFKPPSDEEFEETKDVRIAIVGVPNVGKSSLLNKIVKAERSIVSPIAGTTTDPVDEFVMWRDKYPLTLVDTAGVRKKKSRAEDIEKLSALWALKVTERCHIAMLLLDASQGPSAQSLRLAGFITDNCKSCIIVVNKWDLARLQSEASKLEYEKALRAELKFWYFVPVLFASAKTGSGVDDVVDAAVKVVQQRRTKVAPRKILDIVSKSAIVQPPPSEGKVSLKFKFVTQTTLGGPTFVFFVNRPDLVSDSYSRFLETCIRKEHPFTGTPLRLLFRKSEGKSRPTKPLPVNPRVKPKLVQG